MNLPWYLTVPAGVAVLVAAFFAWYAVWLRLPGPDVDRIRAKGCAVRAEVDQQRQRSVARA